MHIFAYSADPSSTTIHTSYIRTVSGKLFLSPDYGYFEKEITRAEDLKQFLGGVNDVISVKIKKNAIILGGRKSRLGDLSSLAFEDVAVLHQAYINTDLLEQEKERRKKYEIFLTQKYTGVLKKDRNLRKAVKAGKVNYLTIMTRIRKAFPYTSLEAMDSNVGFSLDPLYPGKESKPNYQSGEFLGWWDAHYASVADYEPYYYQLNELLKWSCIMMVVKEQHSPCLDFLKNAPVTRNLDFEIWYKNNGQLKSRTTLPFVDRNTFNTTSECFRILQSKGYPLMSATFFVSGGVSLASQKDIAAKLSKHSRDRHGTGHKLAAKQTLNHKTTCAHVTAHDKKTDKAAAVEPTTRNFGDFTAAIDNRTVKLRWNKNEGSVLDECVHSLASVQMNAGRDGEVKVFLEG